MILKISKKIIFILFFFISITYADDENFNRIEVLVNENVITKYDIVQRMKINAILKRIDINDENYNQLLKAVIEDLITEKLKNKKIDEYNINIEKNEFKKHEERFYSNIKYEKEGLKELFFLNDVNYNYLQEFIEIELKWQKLIYGLYLRVTSVSEKEVNDLISKNPDINVEIANEIILQKQLDIKSTKLIQDLRDEATIEYK
tara:strand:+ start:4317 stop:4925 length:609 start_codon:yes stop_codon:yes gene_type:complete